jgi:DNA topoisomerase IB
MANMPAPKTAAELKRSIRQVGRHVARQLQNTWSAAIKSYVDPKLFQDWENGIS